ncbi:serine/threonine-protein phosphatase 5 [Dorcoceras hygrometricum]|uniref:Serine/threonine-protein phosphatase 5 n=1 Tax=Dorcoceras hygrometricum TaxID=472368 RepID=A0A2Z6ZYL1_9LAMI|nr:serine/threonine-protein phosphatase 5 [Dorcoceras hygrometricum]
MVATSSRVRELPARSQRHNNNGDVLSQHPPPPSIYPSATRTAQLLLDQYIKASLALPEQQIITVLPEQHNATQNSTTLLRTVQRYSDHLVLLNTAQRYSAQHNTTQHSTTLLVTEQCYLEHNTNQHIITLLRSAQATQHTTVLLRTDQPSSIPISTAPIRADQLYQISSVVSISLALSDQLSSIGSAHLDQIRSARSSQHSSIGSAHPHPNQHS